MDVRGAQLSRAYYEELVGPIVLARWPGVPHAAGRLGSGSDVLGLDDALSRDHDWGLRLNLLVAAELVGEIDQHLETALPETFRGHPVRFSLSWDPAVRHRVQVQDVDTLVRSRTGITAAHAPTTAEWLSLTGQAVREVITGPVFADTAGELTAARERLSWYPRDLWTYVVATDWARLIQELPFVGRTADRGDDLGSRVITSRLVGVAMHLGHLLERRWPPYSKWLGTSFAALPRASTASGYLRQALEANDWQSREDGLVQALQVLHAAQRDVGLPSVEDPVERFFDRPYRTVREEVVQRLESSITDPAIRALPRGVGSAEQRSDNVDVLMDPTRRGAATSDPPGPGS